MQTLDLRHNSHKVNRRNAVHVIHQVCACSCWAPAVFSSRWAAVCLNRGLMRRMNRPLALTALRATICYYQPAETGFRQQDIRKAQSFFVLMENSFISVKFVMNHVARELYFFSQPPTSSNGSKSDLNPWNRRPIRNTVNQSEVVWSALLSSKWQQRHCSSAERQQPSFLQTRALHQADLTSVVFGLWNVHQSLEAGKDPEVFRGQIQDVTVYLQHVPSHLLTSSSTPLSFPTRMRSSLLGWTKTRWSS